MSEVALSPIRTPNLGPSQDIGTATNEPRTHDVDHPALYPKGIGHLYVPGYGAFLDKPVNNPTNIVYQKVLERIRDAYLEAPASPDHPDITSSEALFDELQRRMESISPIEREAAHIYGERLIKRFYEPIEGDPSSEVSSYGEFMSMAATASCGMIARDIMEAREHCPDAIDRGAYEEAAYQLLIVADKIHASSVETRGADEHGRPMGEFGEREQAFYDDCIEIKQKILGTDPESIARGDRKLEVAFGRIAAWISDYRDLVSGEQNPSREQVYDHLVAQVDAEYVDELGQVFDWIKQRRDEKEANRESNYDYPPTREEAHTELDQRGLMSAVDEIYDSIDGYHLDTAKDFANKLELVARWARDYAANSHNGAPSRTTARSTLSRSDLAAVIDEYYRMVTIENLDRAIFDKMYDDASSPREALRAQDSYLRDVEQVVNWMAENNQGYRPNRTDAHRQFDDKGLGTIVDELFDDIRRRKKELAEMKPNIERVRLWMSDYRHSHGRLPSREEAYHHQLEHLHPAIDAIYDAKGTSTIDMAREHQSDVRSVAEWMKSYSEHHGRIPSRTTTQKYLYSRGLSHSADQYYHNTTAYYARRLASIVQLADQHADIRDVTPQDRSPALAH